LAKPEFLPKAADYLLAFLPETAGDGAGRAS
jgi:hypothetical protein